MLPPIAPASIHAEPTFAERGAEAHAVEPDAKRFDVAGQFPQCRAQRVLVLAGDRVMVGKDQADEVARKHALLAGFHYAHRESQR
jgi:hypothetical protein